MLALSVFGVIRKMCAILMDCLHKLKCSRFQFDVCAIGSGGTEEQQHPSDVHLNRARNGTKEKPLAERINEQRKRAEKAQRIEQMRQNVVI